MPDEKETEQTISDVSQIEDIDDVIRVLFIVPPEGGEIILRQQIKRYKT